VKEIEAPEICKMFASYKIKSGISCAPYVPLFSPNRNTDKIDDTLKLIKRVPSSTWSPWQVIP
jgi:hypothetical protein